MIRRRLVLLLLIALGLAACQRQNEAELTLVAQNISLETQIAALRQTATVDAERLQITVEYMQTLVARAENQQSQLQATQISQSEQANNNLPAATDVPLPNVTVSVNALTPQFTATPAAASGEAALIEVVMSTGVGDDDCATNPTSEFTTDTPEIYVVARGVNIPAGTNIAARFSIAGQEIRHDFTPDFSIENNCVWFFIDQTDLAFTAGTWSVQLELDGVTVTQPIPFTITQMTEDAG